VKRRSVSVVISNQPGRRRDEEERDEDRRQDQTLAPSLFEKIEQRDPDQTRDQQKQSVVTGEIDHPRERAGQRHTPARRDPLARKDDQRGKTNQQKEDIGRRVDRKLRELSAGDRDELRADPNPMAEQPREQNKDQQPAQDRANDRHPFANGEQIAAHARQLCGQSERRRVAGTLISVLRELACRQAFGVGRVEVIEIGLSRVSAERVLSGEINERDEMNQANQRDWPQERLQPRWARYRMRLIFERLRRFVSPRLVL